MSGLVKRVVVFGPESTGKTTLARSLAGHIGEPWAEEFVREFWEVKDGKITAEDLGTIALGQMANEERAAERARRVVIADVRRGGPVALPALLPLERPAGGWWLAGEGRAMRQRWSPPF